MTLRRTLIKVVLVGAALSVSACATSRDSSLTNADTLVKGSTQGDFQKALADADALWEGRIERAKLEQAISAWEAAVKISSDNISADERRLALAETYAKIARAQYFLADAHIRMGEGSEDAINEQMKMTFEKGVTAAEKSLAVYNPDIAKKMADGDIEAVNKLDKGAVPSLYWYATNMGKWALLEGFGTILEHKDNIKAVMDFVEKESPLYFHGAPPRYFGAYYAKLPGFAGGDLDKSKSYFEQAMAADADWLSTPVLMAELHAVKSEDKAAFKQLLEQVLAYDLDKKPEYKPENEFEQRKARRMLDKMDSYF